MGEERLLLLESLRNAGVSVPNDAVLTNPETLVSICARCLNLIDATASFPVSSNPSSTVDRLKTCTDIALAIKRLGYLASDTSYYQLLYPSEEECYKLVRFLVERLPESSSSRFCVYNNLELEEEDVDVHKEDVAPTMFSSEAEDASSFKASWVDGGKLLPSDESPKSNHEVEQQQKKKKVLLEKSRAKKQEIKNLEEELHLLKAAAGMSFDDQHSIDFYLEQLDEQICAKKSHALELESEWDSFKKSLEENNRILEESIYAGLPGAQEKLQRLRDVEQENHLLLSKIIRRDAEISSLYLEIEKQPKLPSRASYVERIKEITKNSRKQETDVERILKDTRELQLESNSIQERLHRTYAVLDEIVYREAKKDSVGRQAYRLLTSIHESFEQISEEILATDRVRREAAELEKKLGALSSQRLDADKLQADLGSIIKENESLEQRVQHK